MLKPSDILRQDAVTYDKKAAEHAPNPLNPYENFEAAARTVGDLCRVDPKEFGPVEACVALIGVKLGRLKTLGVWASKTANEPVWDTLGDLRVYLAILEAMLRDRAGLPS